MDVINSKDCVREAAIFGALRQDTIDYLLSLSKTIRLESGDYLFKENDPGDAIFLICQGEISIRKANLSQSSLEVVRLRVGDALGEMSIFDMCPRSASAQSIDNCRLLSWQSTDLLGLYQQDLEQFALLQMNIGRELSRRLRRMDEQFYKMNEYDPSIVV